MLQSTLARLGAATEPEDVPSALVSAGRELAPRLVLFAVRTSGLVARTTQGTAPTCVKGTAFAPPEHGPTAQALAGGPPPTDTEDPWLQAAFGLPRRVPCILARVALRGRAVLLLYLDREGQAFTDAERDLVAQVCQAAEGALARVVMRGRASQTAGSQARDEARAIPLTVRVEPTPPPTRADVPPLTRAKPAVHRGHTLLGELTGPQTATEHRPSASPTAPEPARRITATRTSAQAPVPPPTTPRVAAPSPTPEPSSTNRITITDPAAPPPALPPPPRSGVTAHAPLDPDQTLHGIPGEGTPADARFQPPRAPAGIVPLSTPLLDNVSRPRIELDDEDRVTQPAPSPEDSTQARADRALDAFLAHEDPGALRNLQALGEAGLRRLVARFPGPLEVFRRDLGALPPPTAHGPLIRAAVRLGSPLVPDLVELFDHPDPDVRFYAAFVFQELRDPRCVLPLGELAFDASSDVRVIAMRVLETYARTADFPLACRRVRAGLHAPNRTKQLHATRAVGTLRDRHAVEPLIDLLASKDRYVQEAALESLCSITGQQHGLKPHRWRAWFAEHGHEHRVEWIIASLRHRDLPVRRWANDELVRLTGHRVHASPRGDRREQQACVEQWRAWWDEIGHEKLPDQPP